MLGIAWPSMRASLDVPFAGLGLLVAAMTVAQFAASAASGLLRERVGTIALLLASVAAAAGGLAIFAIATGWWATILASAVRGLRPPPPASPRNRRRPRPLALRCFGGVPC